LREWGRVRERLVRRGRGLVRRREKGVRTVGVRGWEVHTRAREVMNVPWRLVRLWCLAAAPRIRCDSALLSRGIHGKLRAASVSFIDHKVSAELVTVDEQQDIHQGQEEQQDIQGQSSNKIFTKVRAVTRYSSRSGGATRYSSRSEQQQDMHQGQSSNKIFIKVRRSNKIFKVRAVTRYSPRSEQ